MRINNQGSFITIRLSSDDTYAWANRPGASWPCSFFSGRRLRADFDAQNGDLVDLTVDGRPSPEDTPVDEFNALISDLAGPRFPILQR